MLHLKNSEKKILESRKKTKQKKNKLWNTRVIVVRIVTRQPGAFLYSLEKRQRSRNLRIYRDHRDNPVA